MDFNVEAINWDTEKRVNRVKIIANEIINSIHPYPSCENFHHPQLIQA